MDCASHGLIGHRSKVILVIIKIIQLAGEIEQVQFLLGHDLVQIAAQRLMTHRVRVR